MSADPSIHSGDRKFNVPDDYPLNAAGCGIDDNGQKFIKVKGVRWFTNLDVKERHEEMILIREYSPEEYPKYDNYDAINIGITADIPLNYLGIMGVPITFLDKYCPDQFEILGLSQKCGYGLKSTKIYDDFKEIRQDGSYTGASGRKTNGNPVMAGKPKSGNYYINNNGDLVHSLYARIFIRKKP